MPASPYADRVCESTISAGTGTLTLAGAYNSNFQAFSAVYTSGTALVWYCVFGGSDGLWEVGLGTYTYSGTTLARTAAGVVAGSSGAATLVNFTAVTHLVVSTAPAEMMSDKGLTLAMASHIVSQ